MFRPDDTPARLPDFRNIGVIARALVGVNLGLMFYLLRPFRTRPPGLIACSLQPCGASRFCC